MGYVKGNLGYSSIQLNSYKKKELCPLVAESSRRPIATITTSHGACRGYGAMFVFCPLSAVMPPVTTKPMARWVEMFTGVTEERGTITVRPPIW